MEDVYDHNLILGNQVHWRLSFRNAKDGNPTTPAQASSKARTLTYLPIGSVFSKYMSVVDSTSRMISRALADLTSLPNSRSMVKSRSEAKYREEVDSMSVANSGLSVDSRSVLKSELVVDSGSAINSKRGKKKKEQFRCSAGRIFSPPLYPPYSQLDLFRGSVWNIKGFIQSHVVSPQVFFAANC